MNRGNITIQPQQGVSYNNPNVQAVPSRGSAVAGETRLAILAGAVLAGYSASPRSWPGGFVPTAAVIVAAAL